MRLSTLHAAATLAALVGLAFALPGAHSARAAPPSGDGAASATVAPDVPIKRLSGSSKPAKAPPDPAPQVVAPVDACVRAAQGAYALEALKLKATYTDPLALRRELALAKESLLGADALRKAGCRKPGEK